MRPSGCGDCCAFPTTPDHQCPPTTLERMSAVVAHGYDDTGRYVAELDARTVWLAGIGMEVMKRVGRGEVEGTYLLPGVKERT